MEVENVDFFYGSNKVLDGVSFSVKEGKVTTLIGANGCGKSTLFNIMTKNLKPFKGTVNLKGESIEKLSLKKFARNVAIVHQYNTSPMDLTVEKLVGYGRLAYAKHYKRNYAEDEKYVDWALEITDTEKFRKKNISDLSGGQKQRVWIAMALAQNTKILLLDEPTTYLDVKYQIEILKLIKKLNKEFKITIIMVLHDINQAIHYSDEIIAMKDGKIISAGTPEEVVTKDLIKKVYDIDLKVEVLETGKFVLAV